VLHDFGHTLPRCNVITNDKTYHPLPATI
jgi:hypothetical protein